MRPYAVTKVFGELVARYYSEVHDFSSICIRVGSVRHKDAPSAEPELMRTWFSHRDARQLFRLAINTDIQFSIYYGVSANRNRFWNIDNAIHDLGYSPEDSADRFVATK